LTAHFAIPATTFVLKAIIDARLKIAYGAFTPPTVSIAPPPRPAPPQNNNVTEALGLILFMHHASPNAAWRNMYEPHVDASGNRIGKSTLILDLHYLLAALGSDLEREAVLGVGMTALHRNGIVPRPMIQQLLGAIAVPPNPTKLMDTLTQEPLQDPVNQPESITISQEPYDTDMSSKMWTAFQSPLRPCAFYLVTTVFLDVDEQFPEAKPVDTLIVAARPAADPAASAAQDEVIQVVAP
jgi:hypothetical protein